MATVGPLSKDFNHQLLKIVIRWNSKSLWMKASVKCIVNESAGTYIQMLQWVSLMTEDPHLVSCLFISIFIHIIYTLQLHPWLVTQDPINNMNNFCHIIPFSYTVSFCPTLPADSDIIQFLQTLSIDWPTASASWTSEEREEKLRNVLKNCTYRENDEEGRKSKSKGEGRNERDAGMTEEIRIHLKRMMEEEQLRGFDPTLCTCTGTF